MKKTMKTLATLLAVLMLFSCFAASAAEGETQRTGNTLVMGESYFSSKFSPFFCKTVYDRNVGEYLTHIPLLGADREGNVVLRGIEGEVIPYNGTDYLYTGIADCEITMNEDGTVVYSFVMREDILFSDGTPMTADDVIFSMYVFSDPAYDGSTTFSTLPITGMSEYLTGVTADIYAKYAEIADAIYAAGPDNTDFSAFTEEQQNAYWGEAMDAAGLKFAAEICNYCIKNYSAYLGYVNQDEVGLGMFAWGYGDPNDDGSFTIADEDGTTFDMVESFPTLQDYWNALVYQYEGNFEELSVTESAGSSLFDFAREAFISLEGPKDAEAGGAITSIAGIEKTGDYSFTVTTDSFDATAIYQFTIAVAPLHYYGDLSLYDYENDMFGFTKGDLTIVKEKTTQPLGAGPYTFVSFENGVVTLKANENYWKGCPKTEYLLLQETTDGDKLTGIVSGTFDFANPNFSNAGVENIKSYNSNGELTGDVITTQTVDNNGYGYIGINANTIKVGDDKTSEESKALRKALATLFAVYRDTVVHSYYGDRASVIQYPITNTSWAAPRSSDEGYAIAYSTDVDGNPIYTADMSEEQKYAAALEAAIGYLKKAGYTWDEASGKFTAAPAGADMSYEFMIPADGVGDHPAYGIATAAKEALASIGLTLEINDVTESSIIWKALEAGECEMWAAAWGGSSDPDMYQVYHSSNVVGLGGTDSNHYAIQDPELDEMILAARYSPDTAFRKATYMECMEIVLDWGVEVPTYQRQNAFIFSTERVNLDTLTPDITTMWEWWHDIENLEMN